MQKRWMKWKVRETEKRTRRGSDDEKREEVKEEGKVKQEMEEVQGEGR